VRAQEKAPGKGEPVAPPAPAIADSGTVTDAPVKELILKGPPPQPRPRLSVKKVLAWIAVGLGVGAVGVVGRLCLIRRAAPIEAPKVMEEDLRPAPGLLLKPSVNQPPEALETEKA
jgi:hypothetical protein